MYGFITVTQKPTGNGPDSSHDCGENRRYCNTRWIPADRAITHEQVNTSNPLITQQLCKVPRIFFTVHENAKPCYSALLWTELWRNDPVNKSELLCSKPHQYSVTNIFTEDTGWQAGLGARCKLVNCQMFVSSFPQPDTVCVSICI